MTKSVFGSFIVQFDIGSERGREINKDIPTYDGKRSCDFTSGVLSVWQNNKNVMWIDIQGVNYV